MESLPQEAPGQVTREKRCCQKGRGNCKNLGEIQIKGLSIKEDSQLGRALKYNRTCLGLLSGCPGWKSLK